VPIDITIIPIGFEGDGAYEYDLDFGRLEDLLVENHDVRRPIDLDSGEPLYVQYLLDYVIDGIATVNHPGFSMWLSVSRTRSSRIRFPSWRP